MTALAVTACMVGLILQTAAMRTTSDQASVRLYHLDDGDGGARTLLYGTLAEALALAWQQTDAVQAGLFLQTDNDVVAFLDMEQG